MNFAESTQYLFSLGNEVSAMKLGLDNIRKLLAALGNLENNYLKVQVAGTNGKGSVCAFLDSISNTAGIRTGTFTSPHLISITERIKINGIDISKEDFARHATTVRETSERLLADGDLEYLPTFFEQITAIALIAFAEVGLELAILETGLGGRLDATTAANAEIAAITRIDLDHQEYLGDTIEEIAAEKAAIINSRTQSVIVGDQKPEARKVIDDMCRNHNLEPNSARSLTLAFLPVGLPGKHQIENAKIAVAVAQELKREFAITDDDIAHGLANARHPGRLEYQSQYLFDGAHNVGGAEALRTFLDEFVTLPITMIFGAMKDKQIEEIAEILFPKATNLILTQPDNSRAMTAVEIAKFADDHKNVILTENVPDALRQAQMVSNDETIILVTGSLYLVGEVKRLNSSC